MASLGTAAATAAPSEPSPVRVERSGPVALVRLARPETSNTLSPAMRQALVAAIEDANLDAGVEGIVLAGSGRAFCAGGDLSTMEGMTAADARARIKAAHLLPRAVHSSEKPVVAAVEGACAGAGLALAALCDLVVAGPDARFVTAFEKVGLMPDLGACWSLSMRIGPQAARRLLMLGGDMRGEQAHEIGLCDVLAERGEAETVADALVRRLAGNAPATRRAVRAFFAQWPTDLEDTLRMEAQTQPGLYLSADLTEGIDAFRAKRPPVWRGR